jgi:hypothetical protein
MTWRARSASDKTDDWPFWYVTDDNPKDYNQLHKAVKMATGQGFPPFLPFLPRAYCEALVEKLNGPD